MMYVHTEYWRRLGERSVQVEETCTSRYLRPLQKEAIGGQEGQFPLNSPPTDVYLSLTFLLLLYVFTGEQDQVCRVPEGDTRSRGQPCLPF